MIGVEMVTDSKTKQPLSPEKMMEIWDLSKELGILLGKGGLNGNVFRIKPPMCITRDDVDFSVKVFETAVEAVEKSSSS